MKNIWLKSALALIALVTLSACTAEKNYRGVAAPHWQELTGEQRQLIVDQAYEKDFGDDTTSKNR